MANVSDLSDSGGIGDSTDNDVIKCIVNPLLSYAVFGLMSGTTANVKSAIIGFFTPDDIAHAKDVLWASGDTSIIGTIKSRKEGSVTPKHEANLNDMIKAIQQLDSADKLPHIAIKASDLALIPRSHPEELNNITLVDRLSKLEERMSNFQGVLDRTVAENTNLRNRLDTMRPYAAAVSHGVPSIVVPSQQSSLKDTSTVMKNISVPMDRRSRDNNRTSPGVNGASFGLTRSASSTSVASGHSGFQHQRHQLKQMRRNAKVITGNVTSSKTFRGAPEPDRQLFIQRVRKEVTETDIKLT